MNFEETFFDSIVKRTLFYDPKIEIKPVHLANGLFRAVCGCYTDDNRQHEVIHPRKNAQRVDVPRSVREMLPTLLGADGTLYGTPNFSSYTLSHVTHITNDNHDRGAGEWLRTILMHGKEPSPAFSLLYNLLMEEEGKRSDELSTLTLPISPAHKDLKSRKPALTQEVWPTSLHIDPVTGEFSDPLIRAIRAGFDMLACYDAPMARYGGKLDTLRRLTIWGCFALYLHLANTGREGNAALIPVLFCMDATATPTLKQASIQSYQWVGRSIDHFFRRQIREQMRLLEEKVQWDDDRANRQRVRDMQWKKTRGGVKTTRTDEENQRDFLNFYNSYRSDTANHSPSTAFANAAADLLDRFLSSSPASVARALGVRIGLLTASRSQTAKLYAPEADLFEVLVRASVPLDEEWTLQQLAQHWADQYGILFGALGNENQRLAEWGISAVAGNEYLTNIERLVDILEWCGYARRYADGVVLVSVQEMR